MVLAPKDFGIIGYASLWFTYSSWVSIGIIEASSREIPSLVKEGKTERALELQNIAISADFIISLILFVFLLFIAYSQNDQIVRNIMIIMSFSNMFSKFYNYLYNLNFLYLDFSLSAKGRFIYSLGYPIVTIGLLFWLGIYTLVLTSMILSIIISVFFLKSRRYNLAFKIDKSEITRLSKIGISLLLGTILYTTFTGLADRTVIAAYLTKEELGLYIFAFNFLALFLEMFKDYARVLKPAIWSESETAASTQEGFFPLRKMAIYFSLCAAFSIGFLQLGFLFLIKYITVKFIGAGIIFLIIASYIFWESIEKIPEIILTSGRVNRQNLVALIWGICLALNIIFDVAVVYAGWGVAGIAFVTTFTQAISAVSMYSLASKDLFSRSSDYKRFISRLLVPFLLPLLFTIIHWAAFGKINLLLIIPISIIVQLLLWVSLIKLYYMEFFSREILKSGYYKICGAIKNIFNKKIEIINSID
ncbi:MAG: oligosaccharide flippase family protein [Melioribacteraceae bacterium]|nr:oligosaccharide flippase family protein [Melioribacteraceae bacterium]